MSVNYCRIWVILWVLFFSSIHYLMAENSFQPQGQAIDSFIRYIPQRDAETMSGEIAIVEADSEYSDEFLVCDKLPLKFSLAQGYIGIENSTAVELPAHLASLSTDFETTLPFFRIQNTYIRFGLSPSFFGDDYSFDTLDFRLPFRSFIIYLADDKLTLLAGVAVYPDFEREVYPILGFIYKANDKLTFNIVPKKPNISCKLNDKVTAFAEGGASFTEYEVKKDDLESAVLRYRELHLGGGVKYKFNEFIQGSVSLGRIFNRSLKYRDSLGKVNIKDGAYVELRLEIRI
ncbi:MAG: hypothetical protein NC916_02400 [Candidatus Omnitrophica bacterium]|nr:hypothetical protein [Candidatus Omnitrophota bacterium]